MKIHSTSPTTATRHPDEDRSRSSTEKKSARAENVVVRSDPFEASSVAARAARTVGTLDEKVAHKVASFDDTVSSGAAASSDAAAHVVGLSGRGGVSLSRQAMLMNGGHDAVSSGAAAVGGVGAFAFAGISASAWGSIPVGAMIAGGALAPVVAVGATALGAGLAYGHAYEKVLTKVIGKSPGDWAYDALHPDEATPTGSSPSTTDGGSSSSPSASSNDGASSTNDSNSDDDSNDDSASGSSASSTGKDDTSTSGSSDSDDDSASGSSDSDDSSTSGSSENEEAAPAAESTDGDNDGDGKDDLDGTTPVGDETGPYVPLAALTGGRLGGGGQERDRKRIETVTGGAVKGPVDDEGASGGGVTVDAHGGGHDTPERTTATYLNVESARHVGFQIGGGGTITPAALLSRVALRA